MPEKFEVDFLAYDWAATSLGPIADWNAALAGPVAYMLNSYQAIFIIAGPQKLFLFNKALADMIGERWPEALGHNVEKLWQPIWDDVGPLIERAYNGESFLIQDAAFMTWPSGFKEKRYYTLAFTSLHHKSGEVIGACCICNDTTDSVARRQRVVDQINRVCRMFDRSRSFVLATQGPKHRIVYANTAFDRISDRKAIIGQTIRQVYPESVGQGIAAQYDHVLRTGESIVIEHRPVYVNQPDGSTVDRTISMVIEPIYDFGESPVGVFVVGEDETPMMDAKGRAAALEAELIHASRVNAVGALGSAIAHELNQPLATISNYAAMARMALDRNMSREQVEECLEGINIAALRAGEVIRSVRELVRKGAPKREMFELAPIVDEAVRLVSVGDNSECEIGLDVPNGTSLWGDPTQVEQVLINLLRNACESTGTERPSAFVRAKRKRSMVEISVEDFGPGIPAEVIADIFTPFRTSKEAGLGLGLSICRTIVEAHGGQIEAKNKPKGGAIFQFTMPATARI